MVKEENWIKVAQMQQLDKIEENMEIYYPIEELLKDKQIKYKYKVEEGLNDIDNVSIKKIKNVYFINLYVQQRDEKSVNEIIQEYEKAEFLAEELDEAEDEVVQKTIPAIILPYIYVVLFGIVIIIISATNFENIILKIIGGVVGILIIIYSVKKVIQKIINRKKGE